MTIDQLIPDGWTTNRALCEEAVKMLDKFDSEWTYNIVRTRNKKFGEMYSILIMDEDGEVVRRVYPRPA